MVLQKENIWTRLKTRSMWVMNEWTPLFAAAVPERQFRYVVGIWISGNMQVTCTLELGKVEEGATREDYVEDAITYEKHDDDEIVDNSGWSPIPVAPADFRQIPKGSYSIIDPIITFEGGTDFAAKVDIVGLSLNATVAYWDWDI